MENEFKKTLDNTSEAIEKLEDKIEDYSQSFAEDASELWVDLKKNLLGLKAKLKTASTDLEQEGDKAQLQAHLGTMEAHDRFAGVKETIEEFTEKVSAKAQTELDTVKLRAYLAKMEAKDFWEDNGETLTQEFSESSDKVKNLTLEAASEIKDYFIKLTSTLSKK